MKLTIFGGTGGVGQYLVRQALDDGHDVTAYARAPASLPNRDALQAIEGELDDTERIAEAIGNADAVLSTLGPRSNTADQVELFGEALTRICSAMEDAGVARLVSISGAGLVLPSDDVTIGRRLVRGLMGIFAKHVLASKEREYEVIRRTSLDWVIVRPPRIVDGPPTGKYQVLPDRVPSAKITRGDVAHFMLRCAEQDEWIRRAPIVGG